MEGNLGFIVTAYVTTFLLVIGYTWSLNRRLTRARNATGRPSGATQGAV